MAGRIAYFAMTGAALAAGMLTQGDMFPEVKVNDVEIEKAATGDVARTVDRIVDRETAEVAGRPGIDGDKELDEAATRALTEAVAELVRAEGSLITARMDEDMPAEAVKQAEQRRDFARDAVERLSQDAKAASRGDRDALRENVRAAVRDAVRS